MHDDESPTEHGFVSYVPGPGKIDAFWLDGRLMLDSEPVQLRTATIVEGRPGPSVLLDDRVCECCPTDAAMTSNGPVVVYRDRSEGEIRDIAIVRAEGENWTEPQLVHADGWRIPGCPVNGPAVAADGMRVGVVWFTGAGSEPRVQATLSSDGGASFAEPILLDENRPVGRVDASFNDKGELVATWIARGEHGSEIVGRTIDEKGVPSQSFSIAQTSTSRSAGVPRNTLFDGASYFAWVDATESPTSLKMAWMQP